MPLVSPFALKSALAGGGRFLVDGAMGTELMAQGVPPNGVLVANRECPEKVLAIHERYLQAGARILTANTFGYRDNKPLAEYVRMGALLAEQSAHYSVRPACVWLSLTTSFIRNERKAIPSLVRHRAILIETCTSLAHAVEAVEIVGAARPAFLAVSFHFTSGGVIPDGSGVDEVIREIAPLNLDALGVNCGDSPESFIRVLARLRMTTDCPLIVQPSAGVPPRNREGERFQYPVQPDRLAAAAKTYLDLGARFVGGCCGTTPAHIRAIYDICFREANKP